MQWAVLGSHDEVVRYMLETSSSQADGGVAFQADLACAYNVAKFGRRDAMKRDLATYRTKVSGK